MAISAGAVTAHGHARLGFGGGGACISGRRKPPHRFVWCQQSTGRGTADARGCAHALSSFLHLDVLGSPRLGRVCALEADEDGLALFLTKVHGEGAGEEEEEEHAQDNDQRDAPAGKLVARGSGRGWGPGRGGPRVGKVLDNDCANSELVVPGRLKLHS